MKYLICGLGNPGKEYENTRHNVGFMVLDHFAKSEGFYFSENRFGSTAEHRFKGRTLFFIKPNTYMNLSGKAIQFWMQKEKIPAENLLVITDDLALPFGMLRLRTKGSDGGHNGLKSITELLGSSDYARLRFGIGSNFGKGQQVNYVLSSFAPDEASQIAERAGVCAEIIKSFVSIGAAHTMTAFNNK